MKIDFDLRPNLIKKLDKNWELLLITRDEPLEAGIHIALSNYVELFEIVKKNLKPQFTVSEIIFLMDIINGLIEFGGSMALLENFIAEIENIIKYENLCAKHNMTNDDVNILINKLKVLSVFERWVLIVSIKGVWLENYVVEDDELELHFRKKIGHILID